MIASDELISIDSNMIEKKWNTNDKQPKNQFQKKKVENGSYNGIVVLVSNNSVEGVKKNKKRKANKTTTTRNAEDRVGRRLARDRPGEMKWIAGRKLRRRCSRNNDAIKETSREDPSHPHRTCANKNDVECDEEINRLRVSSFLVVRVLRPANEKKKIVCQREIMESCRFPSIVRGFR